MTWYAVYVENGGELVSVGTRLGDPLRRGLAVLELPGEPDTTKVMWDRDLLAFVDLPEPPPPPPDPVGDLEAWLAQGAALVAALRDERNRRLP